MPGQLKPDGETGDQPANEECQKGGGSVADIEAGIVEPAGRATRGEFRQAAEKPLGPAPRAQSEKGSLDDPRLPF